MTKTLLLASTALLFTASAAFAGDKPQVAETPVPTGPTSQAPLADASQRGVLVFTPDFFAAQRPNTALDMVNRVPASPSTTDRERAASKGRSAMC